MFQTMTRSLAIRVWFVAVILIVVTAIAIGVQMTIGTAAMLLALCLVPPVVVLFVWPGAQPPTASEILHGSDRRP